MNSKKYWHSEDVYTLYDENDRRFGIIGFSQIAHESSPDVKFVIYKAYFKPLWSSEFILHSKGEVRWDGFTLGMQNPSVQLRGLDDLLSSMILQFSIYTIADEEYYIENMKDNFKQKGLYDAVLRDYFDKFIDYKHAETEDYNLKKELTEMSQKSISAMMNDNKGDGIEI